MIERKIFVKYGKRPKNNWQRFRSWTIERYWQLAEGLMADSSDKRFSISLLFMEINFPNVASMQHHQHHEPYIFV